MRELRASRGRARRHHIRPRQGGVIRFGASLPPRTPYKKYDLNEEQCENAYTTVRNFANESKIEIVSIHSGRILN